jgi:hypothetical protein
MRGTQLPRFPDYAAGILKNLLAAIRARKSKSGETVAEFKQWAYCVAGKADLPAIDLDRVLTKDGVCDVLVAVLLPVFNEHEGHTSLAEWDEQVQDAIEDCPFDCEDCGRGAETGSSAGTVLELPKSPKL